jgi:type II secretory pathway pseudopilin PulG
MPVKSFTLLETIIVLILIAVLITILIIILKPSAILSSVRDNQRILNLMQFNQAIRLALLEPDIILASPYTIHLSLKDTNSDCSSYPNLPTLPSNWSYKCSNNPKKTDGTGWLPIKFSSSTIAKITNLAVDPLNKEPYYYTYTASSTKALYELTTYLESSKNKGTGSISGKDEGTNQDLYEAGKDKTTTPNCFETGRVGGNQCEMIIDLLITHQNEWQLGVFDVALDTVNSPGDIKIFPESKINPDIGLWTTDGSGDVKNLYDDDTATGVLLNTGNFFIWDFGSIANNVFKYRAFRTGGPADPVFPGICVKPKSPLTFSCGDVDGDGVEWTNLAVFGNTNLERDIWDENLLTPADYSKWRLIADDNYTIAEFEVYFAPLVAHHKTAFSQVGSNQGLGGTAVRYEIFTPEETQPNGSNIIYRFRKTNKNGSWAGNWTDYVDFIGTPINLSQYSNLTITQQDILEGKTFLQIETKLSRDTITVEPYVSAYTIKYVIKMDY